jgi:proline racemase
VGETFLHRSIIDTTFDARIEALTRQGSIDAIVPSVAGQAWITDFSKLGVDPSDPFPQGVTLGDTWMESITTHAAT